MNGFYRRVEGSVFSYIEDIRSILNEKYLPIEVISLIKKYVDLNFDYPVYGIGTSHSFEDDVMLSLSLPNGHFIVRKDNVSFDIIGKLRSKKIEFDWTYKDTKIIEDPNKLKADRILLVNPNPIAYTLNDGTVYFNGRIEG